MEDYVWYIVGGVLAIVIIIVIIVLASKKKKINKEEVKVEEEKPIVEETKIEIEKPIVEEVKEEPKPTKKAEKKVETEKKVLLGKFAISFDPNDNNYRYRLYASNGECLVVSEIYASKESCIKGIETLKNNAKPENIALVEDKHGLFSFRVTTEVGKRLIVTSANYPTKQSGENAIASFLKNVVTDKMVENEKNDHDEAEEYKEIVEPIEGGKVRIFVENEEYFYQLIANNGRVIATSQGYKTKKTAIEAAERMRELVYNGIFFIFKDKKGQFQFKLYNVQKRLMLAGEVYDTKAKVNNVIASLKRFFKLAVIEDEA